MWFYYQKNLLFFHSKKLFIENFKDAVLAVIKIFDKIIGNIDCWNKRLDGYWLSLYLSTIGCILKWIATKILRCYQKLYRSVTKYFPVTTQDSHTYSIFQEPEYLQIIVQNLSQKNNQSLIFRRVSLDKW